MIGNADEGGRELKAQLLGLVVDLGQIVKILIYTEEEVVNIGIRNIVGSNDNCAHCDRGDIFRHIIGLSRDHSLGIERGSFNQRIDVLIVQTDQENILAGRQGSDGSRGCAGDNEGCIDAVKERQADVYRQQHLRQLTDDNFGIFYGYDICPVECLTFWGDGWVCGTGNLFPRENVEVYKKAKARDVEGAMKAQEEGVWPYLHLFSKPDSNGEILWLQIIKEGLKLRGVDAGYCRKPVFSDLPEETVIRLKDTLKHFGYLG